MVGSLVGERNAEAGHVQRPHGDGRDLGALKDAFTSKHCLIPADGFYEWTKAEDGGKDPWHIHLPGHAPFSFAGLWAHNK